MSIRSQLATFALNAARSFGRTLGCQIAVEAGSAELKTTMELPDNNKRDWDEQHFRRGCLFIQGYANPVVPVLRRNEGAINRDEIDAEFYHDDDDLHVALKSSKQYVETIESDAAAQLMNPKERWRILAYGILALGVLMFVNMIMMFVVIG